MADKTFKADAHIPSDTEAFDKKVVEMKPKKLSPEREELNMKFGLLASRLASFANFHMQNEHIKDDNGNDVGLGPISIQNFVQLIVTNAQLMEFCTMLQEKLSALSTCFNALTEEPSHTARKEIYRTAAMALATSDTEIFARTVKNLEEHVKGLQNQFGIAITAEGVTVNERPKQPSSDAGTDTPQKPN